MRHIRDALGFEINGWYVGGGVAGLDGSILFAFDLLGVVLFCEVLELLLNGLDFDLRLFRSEERKGIGKVMRIFIRNFTVFLLSNVVWLLGSARQNIGPLLGPGSM